jgi:hypothetical protein
MQKWFSYFQSRQKSVPVIDSYCPIYCGNEDVLETDSDVDCYVIIKISILF